MENNHLTNPSSIVNILTLRYDPNLSPNLPIKTWNDFKPNIQSADINFIEKLQEQGVSIHIYDPYFVSKEIFGIQTESNVDDVIQDLDACILVTAHDEFKKLPISLFNKMKHPILVDTRGVFDPLQAESAKLTFRGLGRGK